MRINKDQVSLGRWENLKFFFTRGSGHLTAFFINRIRWHLYPRLHLVTKFPPHLDIETSSLCNMQCPMCFTTTDKFQGNTPKGLMSLSLFKKIIDESKKYNLYSIRISHRGEPFIHPEVIQCISLAKRSGIKEVSSLSNILDLTPELFEKVMQAGLDWLTISFDGSGDTYERIRRPAKFQEAYQKIKDYKKIKDRKRSLRPVIKIQSIWPAVKDDPQRYLDLFKPYVDAIAFNPLIDYLHKDDPEKIEYWENFDCPTPYQRLTILFNGLVPYCHNDEFNTFIIGDVNKERVYDIWHSRFMSEVRTVHRKYGGVKCLSACKYCFLPRKTVASQEFIGNKNILVEKYTGRTEEVVA